jgi:Zn-dependent protease with chaperone function
MAQESAEDDADGYSGVENLASLSLSFDSQGSVDATLDLSNKAESMEALQTTLARALHCAGGRFDTPGRAAIETSFQAPSTWTSAQRERYRKQTESYLERRLTGGCTAVMARQQGLFQGDFDYSELSAALHRAGVEQLSLYVSIPKTEFRDYTQTNLVAEPKRSSTFLVYQILLGENSEPLVLHLVYGFRRQDVYRAFAILAGFILIPLFITLWMRRSALASAKEDAAGAWFGFARSLNVLLMGSMLLWLTSGLGAKQILHDWILGQGLDTWQVALSDVFLLVAPAFLSYLVCMAVSYPVHEQLRGSQLTYREFLARQIVTVAAQALPLMLALAALQLWKDPEFAVILLALAFATYQLLKTLKLRVLKSFPQPLTTGELRDRVFALAGRLGVKVSQVFVVPAGKGQVANAYAAKGQIVMFTDYLLEHLSKREVDGVTAHELAHLLHKHPAKRLAAFGAAMFLPTYFVWIRTLLTTVLMIPLRWIPAGHGITPTIWVWSAMSKFDQWSQRDFVLVMLGLMGFYFLARHHENVADATGVRLTGDPEAAITGMLKLSRLNRMPIHWGKASESWLTHPSTMRRLQRMAAAGGMAPERLQEILVQYNAHVIQNRESAATVPGSDPAEEHYAVPVGSDPEIIRTALHDRVRMQVKRWSIYAVYVLPLAVFSLLIQWLRLEGWSWVAHLGGIAITVALVTLSGVWIGESGHAREKRRLLQRFERDHVPAGREGDVAVGFAPAPYPRIYGSQYHWDGAFLVFAKDRLQFVGEKIRFSLTPEQVDGIAIGRGGPSWWKFDRIYLRWKDTASGRGGIFNLYLLEPGSMWRTRSRLHSLTQRLQEWQRNPHQYPEVRPEFAELKAPELGEVTCASPSLLGTFKLNVKALAHLWPLALGVGILLHAEIFYVCQGVFLVRMFQQIPIWRYRDRMPLFPPSATVELPSKARGASASAYETL